MKFLRPAFALTLFFILFAGLAFPALITGIAQAAFPHQANGSLIRGVDGSVVGSELIGQPFAAPENFHSRPSAAGVGYDAANSGGTNLGPLSDKLINGLEDGSFAGVKQLAVAYRKENGLSPETVLPTDAVTRSASGLDPHISVRNAMLQAPRVAAIRKVPREKIESLIRANTAPAFLSIFGDPAVNVLKLNLSLKTLE